MNYLIKSKFIVDSLSKNFVEKIEHNIKTRFFKSASESIESFLVEKQLLKNTRHVVR